jgi:hypothetical protein
VKESWHHLASAACAGLSLAAQHRRRRNQRDIGSGEMNCGVSAQWRRRRRRNNGVSLARKLAGMAKINENSYKPGIFNENQ